MTTSIEKLLEKLLMLGICIVIALTYILHIPEYVDTWENVLEGALQLEKEYQEGVQ